jgi:RNA polymerase sigma-70 factor (ECF subfamily)
MNNYTDHDLLVMFKKTDKRNYVFNHIINLYQENIYWHIRKILISHDDSNDVCQNTFIKVYENFHKFKGESRIYTWIYKIATNESLSFLKKKKKFFFESLDKVSSSLITNLVSDKYFDGNDAEKKLQKALLTLPIKQRIVFNMKYFDEMKYYQISEILGTSVGALKANYHHAKNKIQKFLNEN